MLKLEELMNVPIKTSRESTLEDVRKIMIDKKLSRVLVTENEKITSIITKKDLGLFLLTDKSGRTLEQILSQELAKPLLRVSPFLKVRDCAKKDA